MSAKKKAIECLSLHKTFGGKPVLEDISFEVGEGTVLGLVGPNGAGKTTLLKILATLVLPSTGKALICGRDVTVNPIQVKKRLGIVFSEERSFYWRLTGFQNLRFFASLHNLNRKDRAARINELLEAVGLGEKGHVRFREYSSGMKQALGIARGMLHDPPILLLDEPTRSLSPDIAGKVRKLIRDKAEEEGKTVLIASHNLKEVEHLADRIAVIHQGSVRAIGTAQALKGQCGLSQSSDLEMVFESLSIGD
ncbi:MAG: ABC transporter ATP-binding protein [Thermodesulfobacteriota bacterium]|nr:ABC transporter ATP-binding protein [Thermodesulfobacteriota bacterium]